MRAILKPAADFVASGDCKVVMWADLAALKMRRAEQLITLNFIKENPRRASKVSITIIRPREFW